MGGPSEVGAVGENAGIDLCVVDDGKRREVLVGDVQLEAVLSVSVCDELHA